MRIGTFRVALLSALAMAVVAVSAPSALASSTPTLSLDQSAGNTAGSSTNLGMNLSFANTGLPTAMDSPDQMTIVLPPGLLANASIDGGACLKTADLTDTACQVGTGTVTADPLGVSLVPITLPVTFDLVPPPAPGDLAGLAVNYASSQIGDTAAITVRPSGDPNGVGVSISFVLPNSLAGAPISITNIDSRFDGLRYPTTCPSTPADVKVSVNSYDDSTMQTVAAPLSVTGCSTLPYAPKLAVSVANTKGTRQVQVTTSATQAAADAPTRSLTLAFPGSALNVNLAAVKVLCTNLAAGKCTPVGTATATSPLYPQPLVANAYLTGTFSGPTLTLVFPAPFPLRLVGAVNLTTLTATFNGLPDIPLTDLSLVLSGNSTALFNTNCRPPNGVADATLTDQNGDETAKLSSSYTISGCAGSTATSATPGASGSAARPTISKPGLTKLGTGRPSLSFTLRSAGKSAELTTFTVEPPTGLRFIDHRVGGKLKVEGVTVHGAKVKSLKLSHGKLVITLRKPATRVEVLIAKALTESSSLTARARHGGKLRSTKVTVITRTTARRTYTLVGVIKHPRR